MIDEEDNMQHWFETLNRIHAYVIKLCQVELQIRAIAETEKGIKVNESNQPLLSIFLGQSKKKPPPEYPRSAHQQSDSYLVHIKYA